MKLGPLSLFNRTSSRDTLSLASWHSPHSLTWRWSLCLRRHAFMWPKPFATRNSVGAGLGIGTLLSLTTFKNNGGRQWEVSLLWHGLHFAQQRPMWFRDMYRRAFDESEELRDENNRLHRQLADLQFLAARSADPSVGAGLN
jgi:hypothetical protein